MDLHQHLEDILSPAFLEKGFGIVRLQVQGTTRKTLQIMIERLDDLNVSIDDCVAISRLASALLDVEDLIAGSYTLEVGSAGLDRPLVKLSDFERFKGAMVKIELKIPLEGMRRFRGVLMGVEGDKVKIQQTPSPDSPHFGIAELTFSDIQKAKIIPDYEQPQQVKPKK